MNQNKEIKCVCWDLDNTLWEGTLLEGEVTLKPGIIDIIEQLDSRGILQTIASKNNYEDVKQKLEAFNIFEYFLYPEINWNAKSASIGRIQQHLNIGMDTILFIDDLKYEREEVLSVHPEVMCMDALEYTDLLNHPRLNPRFITEDAARRRIMYMEDIERSYNEQVFQGPKKDFLEQLNMKLIISHATEEDLQRAEELTLRTNQLNSTGITYSYEELNELKNSSVHRLFICEFIDKYGSYGKIGLALVDIREKWHLKLFLMSCRVLSRGIGSVMLSYIMQEAKKNNSSLLADFRETYKNKQMYLTYKMGNFKPLYQDGKNVVFEHDLSQIPHFPHYIHVITPN